MDENQRAARGQTINLAAVRDPPTNQQSPMIDSRILPEPQTNNRSPIGPKNNREISGKNRKAEVEADDNLKENKGK